MTGDVECQLFDCLSLRLRSVYGDKLAPRSVEGEYMYVVDSNAITHGAYGSPTIMKSEWVALFSLSRSDVLRKQNRDG